MSSVTALKSILFTPNEIALLNTSLNAGTIGLKSTLLLRKPSSTKSSDNLSKVLTRFGDISLFV